MITGIVIDNIGIFEKLITDGYKLEDKHIITTDIRIIAKIENSNSLLVNLWNYIEDDFLRKSEVECLKLLDSLASTFEKELNLLGVSLFDVTKAHILEFLRVTIFTQKVLMNVFENYSFNEIYFPNKEYSKHSIDSFRNSDVLSSVLKYYCDLKMIKAKYYNAEFKINGTRIENICAYKEFDNLIDENQKLLFLLKENYENDEGMVQYFNSKKYIEFNVIWNVPNKTKNLSSRLNNVLFFNDFSFQTKEEYNNIKELSGKKNVIEQFLCRRGMKEYDFIFKNKYFKPELEHRFLDFRTYIKDLFAINRICDFLNPYCIYFGGSTDLSTRAQIVFAKNRGIKTFCTIHGGLTQKWGYHLRKFTVDNYFVNGENNKVNLIAIGQPEHTIKVVGSLNSEELQEKIKTDKKENHVFTVSIFTSDGYGFGASLLNENCLLESFKSLLELIKKNSNIRFIIRPHPRYDYDLINLTEINGNIRNLRVCKYEKLEEVIEETDIAILYNVVSNVALELSTAGKPIVYLKDSYIKDELYDDESLIDLYTVESVLELEKSLLNYIYNEEFKTQLEKNRKDFLRMNLEADDKSVYSKIENILEEQIPKNKAKIKYNNTYYNIILSIRYNVLNQLYNQTLLKDLNLKEFGNDSYILEWLYRLCDQWCIYYGKEDNRYKYFINYIFKNYKYFKFGFFTVLQYSIYSYMRDIYLRYNLNNNSIIRKLIRRK